MTSIKSAKQYKLLKYIKIYHVEFQEAIEEFEKTMNKEEFSIDFVVSRWDDFLSPLYELRFLNNTYREEYIRIKNEINDKIKEIKENDRKNK